MTFSASDWLLLSVAVLLAGALALWSARITRRAIRRRFDRAVLRAVHRFQVRLERYKLVSKQAIREDLLEAEPWLATATMDMFDCARDLAATYYEDPNWSRLAWGRHYFENERTFFGRDPWQNGFARNRANIERMIRYSHDQGLIEAPYEPETLFVEDTLDT